MGQKSPEPLLKCAFVAGLPVEVAVQLKSISAIEKLSLAELVTRARMILSTSNGQTTCAAGVTKVKGVQCSTCSDNLPSSNMKPPSRRPLRCYNCHVIGHISRNCPQKGNGNGGVSAPDTLPTTK